jgi:hypothetical protein
MAGFSTRTAVSSSVEHHLQRKGFRGFDLTTMVGLLTRHVLHAGAPVPDMRATRVFVADDDQARLIARALVYYPNADVRIVPGTHPSCPLLSWSSSSTGIGETGSPPDLARGGARRRLSSRGP